MDSKSPDAFRTISEVSERLDTPTHVLRFWESRFPQVRPVKRAGGRRYYRPTDVALLGGIKKLLHDDGMTIRSVQKMLRDQGVRYVADLGAAVLGEDPEGAAATIVSPPPAPTLAPPPRPEAAHKHRELAVNLPPPEAQATPVQADLFGGADIRAKDTGPKDTGPKDTGAAHRGQGPSDPTALARRLRALAPERLRDIAPELTAIHARLVALRNRMADDGK